MECILYASIFIIGACWGSFLNSIAWRLVADTPLVTCRSLCPACGHTIAWYDITPIISWIILRGTCRQCHAPISILYPCIEVLTGVLAVAAWMTISTSLLPWYGIYASLLLISLHTDMRYHVLSPWVTVYVVPFHIAAAILSITPITWYESIIAGVCGYTLFAMLNGIFQWYKGIRAIGYGDWELIAFIASGTGIAGLAYTMLWSSVLTLIYAALFQMYTQNVQHDTPLPFGACLAIAGLIFPLLCV